MSIVNVYTDNSISINGKITGYSVFQHQNGTVVRKNHNNGYPYPKDLGEIIELPKNRYALATEGGLEEFKRDLLSIINSLLI